MFSVLIVEDEMLVCRGLSVLVDWEALGFTIGGYCGDGLSAKRQLEMMRYDLVICDIHIPGMSGLDLIRWMREQNMDTEIIVISAYAEFEYAQRVIDDGVVAYLLKPINEVLLEDALTRVRQRLKGRASERPEGENRSEKKDVVLAAVMEMHRDCGKNCNADALAKKLYVSTSQLNGLFRKRYGVSVKEYINGVRMTRAKFLLEHTEKMIYEIAKEVGFQDIDYFSRLFKQETGMTPGGWRRESREKD